MDTCTLITGAASGIGAAFARRIAAPGIGLVLHGGGTTPDSARRLDAVTSACEAAGARCILSRGDLATTGPGAAAVATALAGFGRLDHVVHAAGFVDRTPLGALTRAELGRSLALMPGALLEIVTAATPGLIQSGSGRVVAISSFVAHRLDAPPFAPASAVAKAALETLVRCLAVHLAPHGVTVNAVIPGYTRKDAGKPGALSAAAWDEAAARTPTGRLNETDEVAAAIQFLLSDDARQITGAMLPVDGGLIA